MSQNLRRKSKWKIIAPKCFTHTPRKAAAMRKLKIGRFERCKEQIYTKGAIWKPFVLTFATKQHIFSLKISVKTTWEKNSKFYLAHSDPSLKFFAMSVTQGRDQVNDQTQ